MTGAGYTSTPPTCLHGAYSGKFIFYRKTYGVGLGGGRREYLARNYSVRTGLKQSNRETNRKFQYRIAASNTIACCKHLYSPHVSAPANSGGKFCLIQFLGKYGTSAIFGRVRITNAGW